MKRFLISPTAKSWLPVPKDTHFPIQNLPFGVALLEEEQTSVVVRLGDHVIALLPLQQEGLLADDMPLLEDLTEFSPSDLSELRKQVFDLLREGSPKLRDNREMRTMCIAPIEEVFLVHPMHIAAFVDFYSGINHASNVGKMFRPDMPPLLPNYRWLPVAYNGRASSVIVSGVDVPRPSGQRKPAEGDPTYGPTRELDFELEMGFFVGRDTDMGQTVKMDQVDEFMMGMVLVNDWSARDVQRWEYQPLGPFLAKSFATSISPWMVTLDALEPFRVQGETQDPPALDYLAQRGKQHYDIQLEVFLQTPKMAEPERICLSNARHLYWSFAQQLVHQASNGTALEHGDLYGSGTISGTEPNSYGSMLELTWRGANPIKLSSGEERTFLEDGDTLIMTGFAQGDGFKIGFGEIRTTITAAPKS
ncbi:MAG: fumarylacetoacetase [Chthonomonas sp.]|nr:fumarylacetoacetase [Chthonomonas sp.]